MSVGECDVFELGYIEYREAERLQERLVAARRAGDTPDTLLLLEHPAVVTIGRTADDAHAGLSRRALTAAGVPVHSVSRGGRATWHGPGQVVGYPIVDLRAYRTDLHWYLRALEEVIVRALRGAGYRASRVEGLTGVWSNGRKVASIGIAVRGWVTWHGFAVNRDCDPAAWRLIDPCGLPPEQMASLAELPGATPSRAELQEALVAAFEEVLGVTARRRDRTELFR
ncbi:MAG: lipoyl(octanoyl) transferase LipB, partial [Armatimonadota bacterium]